MGLLFTLLVNPDETQRYFRIYLPNYLEFPGKAVLVLLFCGLQCIDKRSTGINARCLRINTFIHFIKLYILYLYIAVPGTGVKHLKLISNQHT